MYFGLSAGLQLLNVASFTLALYRNDFARCSVIRSSGFYFGGNVYGGGISIYMGGYSSSIKVDAIAVAAVGNTVVRNSSVLVETVSFTSCRATTAGGQGANSYGGSLSMYLGGYTWSWSRTYTIDRSSSSTSGSTTASGVSVSISNVNSSDCSATSYPVASSTGAILGVNSYGGSMSVIYIGAYAWSSAAGGQQESTSSSVCGTTNVTSLVVSISSSTFADSSAGSRTFHSAPLFSFPCAYSRSSAEFGGGFAVSGSNVRAFAIGAPSIILPLCMRCPLMQGLVQVYGGTASIMIGSYSWSYDDDNYGYSMAKSGDTYCSSCTVDVSGVTIINSTAVSKGKPCAAFRLLQRLCSVTSAHDCVGVLQWLPH